MEDSIAPVGYKVPMGDLHNRCLCSLTYLPKSKSRLRSAIRPNWSTRRRPFLSPATPCLALNA